MVYSIDEIKQDLKDLSENSFFEKYYLRSDNWYFEKYLGIDSKDLMRIHDDYRLIISKYFDICINSVIMVGSGKIGFSLCPPTDKYQVPKTFLPFEVSGKTRRISDLDIAIISNRYFHEIWRLIRNSPYSFFLDNTYKHVYQEIYRGFISERNITEFDESRKMWVIPSNQAKKELMEDLYLKHSVSFRVYRNIDDFKEYCITGINKLKRGIYNGLSS